MDKAILPESYFTEGNLVEEDANTATVTKKTCKRKCRKTQNRSKSARTASSTLEASPAWAKTATQTDEERVKQVVHYLHLSSDSSDSEVLDNTGNPPKGGHLENSRPDPQGPPVAPDQSLAVYPVFQVGTNYWITVRIIRYHSATTSAGCQYSGSGCLCLGPSS